MSETNSCPIYQKKNKDHIEAAYIQQIFHNIHFKHLEEQNKPPQNFVEDSRSDWKQRKHSLKKSNQIENKHGENSGFEEITDKPLAHLRKRKTAEERAGIKNGTTESTENQRLQRAFRGLFYINTLDSVQAA